MSRRGRRWGRRGSGVIAALLFALASLWPLRAPATVEEQRARLPPAADCADEPIAGLWKSHNFRPRRGYWSIFTLDIHRVEGDTRQLTGRISNHLWYGGAQNEEPPACRPGGVEYLVSMPARGTFDATGHLDFYAYDRWQLDRVLCNRGPHRYNLDHFSGQLDAAIHEFQSVNNDGGAAVNDPTVFRRVRCHPPDARQAPEVEATPPPFYPRLHPRGCGR